VSIDLNKKTECFEQMFDSYGRMC